MFGQVKFGTDPVQMQCPYCQESVVTTVGHKPGVLNALACLVCCLLSSVALPFCLPCSVIPCLMLDLSDATHSCPYCQRVIHRHSAGGC